LAARRIYRVVPDGALWRVKHNGVVLSTHYTKAAAVSEGRTIAKANAPSQLVVHRQDGSIEEEFTYELDPYPPLG
jgi:hypothetical protein